MKKDKVVAPTMPQRVYEYLKKRGVEASKGEICKSLEVNHEAIRKTLTRMVDSGVIIATEDSADTGVVRYKLHENATFTLVHGRPAVIVDRNNKPAPKPVAKPKVEAKVKEYKASTHKEMSDDPKDTLEQMYGMGYAKGYHEAMEAGHRDAYNAGRRTVIEGLLKLLKLDARVLM